MKRLDLIINALDRVDTFDWNQQDNKLIKDALAAARELREMKPVGFFKQKSAVWQQYDEDHPAYTALYKLD